MVELIYICIVMVELIYICIVMVELIYICIVMVCRLAKAIILVAIGGFTFICIHRDHFCTVEVNDTR